MFLLGLVFVHHPGSPRRIGFAAPRRPTGGDSSHGEAPSARAARIQAPPARSAPRTSSAFRRRRAAAASGGKAVRAARIQASPAESAPRTSSGFRRRRAAAASVGKAVGAARIQAPPAGTIVPPFHQRNNASCQKMVMRSLSSKLRWSKKQMSTHQAIPVGSQDAETTGYQLVSSSVDLEHDWEVLKNCKKLLHVSGFRGKHM
ncbi:uncharacterized protein LOC120713403 [Panicum virgatum]|nr:uncharacterized protein LOC120713403 [Panicum virgatum]